MRQRREDGSLKEADPRLSQESLQYKIMLAADVMISLLECNKDEEQEAAELIMGLVTFIENNIDNINNSLALAKAAYAMKLFEIDSESTAQIITKLKEFMKRDKLSKSKKSSGHFVYTVVPSKKSSTETILPMDKWKASIREGQVDNRK
uniref:Uncharacterized protein n=1 Tax=Biomphalaria glabrata TaxID=6526 RepID=A0A182YTT9_BIOGL